MRGEMLSCDQRLKPTTENWSRTARDNHILQVHHSLDKYLIHIALWLFLLLGAGSALAATYSDDNSVGMSPISEKYNDLAPADQRPSYDAFRYGMEGYRKMLADGMLDNDRYLTIVDYSLPSTQKRMWVIDVKRDRIVQRSLVAHGRNSGVKRAHSFSNKPGSYKSSIGFFLTGKVYRGKHGLSLRLTGVEPGINDHARERDIVIHPASYATHSFIDRYGRLGRSYGCLALPPAVTSRIIREVKRRSSLFVYYPDSSYLEHSKFLGEPVSLTAASR